jgi:hypothetical protein
MENAAGSLKSTETETDRKVSTDHVLEFCGGKYAVFWEWMRIVCPGDTLSRG